MKTAAVKRLVNEVLKALPMPYTEHVIDEVFDAIEHTPGWRQEYDDICVDLGKTVANTWGGYWIANALGKVGEQQVPSKKSTLIRSYSILDTDAKASTHKPKQAEAQQLMFEYFQSHRRQLPSDIRKHRDLIIQLLMEGLSPPQAFAMVIEDNG